MVFLRRNQLWLFFTITLAFSASIAAVASASQHEGISILIPLSPSIIAILITAIFSGRAGLREMFIGLAPRFSLRWLAIALLLFLLIASLAILIHALFGGPPLSGLSPNMASLIGGSLLIPLGEEFGWRGYALPRLLKKYSAVTASLILGVIWGMWHFPGFLIGVGVVEGLPFVFFILWVVGATMLMTWVFNHTKSIWSMILMHGIANATFNLLPITPNTAGGPTTFFIFIGLVWLVTVIVILKFGPQTLAGKKVNDRTSCRRFDV